MSDTSPAAAEVYFRRLASLTPSERVRLAVDLWAAADGLQRAALRRAYPAADEAEITFRLAVSRFGADLARKAYRRDS